MSLRQPPIEHGSAKTTDFGGWAMPVEFDSIRTEHTAVRESVGKFDVSHMGEITVSGPDATRLLQRLTTNDVAALEPGEGQYAAITDEDGIIANRTVSVVGKQTRTFELRWWPTLEYTDSRIEIRVDGETVASQPLVGTLERRDGPSILNRYGISNRSVPLTLGLGLVLSLGLVVTVRRIIE